MKTNEIEKYFGLTRSTLSVWRKQDSTGRKLLLRVLESLPVDYVENILEKEKEGITKDTENKKLLEGEK
jgi:hypothetical protein